MNKDYFKIGYPIPKTWLHLEFDFEDSKKYCGGAVIENEKELERLQKKYL